jgi:exonuclease III
MRIATWNVERLRASTHTRNQRILAELEKFDADVLVLTETNLAICPGDRYSRASTGALAENAEASGYYGRGEHRVTIWTKYRILEKLKTYNSRSAVCVRIEAPFDQSLLIYGTVIGHHGNRHEAFKTDLDGQIHDWTTRYGSESICIAGDYNLSFGDKYYFTKYGREQIMGTFAKQRINLLTGFEENIDHIAISDSFMQSVRMVGKPEVWNPLKDRKLSDHIGVCVTLVSR